MTGRLNARNQRAVQHRQPAIDGIVDDGDVVNLLQPVQARREHARSGAVAGVNNCIPFKEIDQEAVRARIGQDSPQDEYVAPANPHDVGPCQLPGRTRSTHIGLPDVETHSGEVRNVSRNTTSTYVVREAVQRVGDESHGPALAGQCSQAVGEVAHPK